MSLTNNSEWDQWDTFQTAMFVISFITGPEFFHEWHSQQWLRPLPGACVYIHLPLAGVCVYIHI